MINVDFLGGSKTLVAIGLMDCERTLVTGFDVYMGHHMDLVSDLYTEEIISHIHYKSNSAAEYMDFDI